MKTEDIQEIYVFLSQQPGGGIVALKGDTGLVTPLFTADANLVDAMRGVAEDAAIQSGYPVKLVKFSSREVIETLGMERPNLKDLDS